ncbi:uncharacterized protein LOC144654865 isoform X3 [Oculina patagonica]
MKAAFFAFGVLFCLLVPSHGASSDDKNVSTSTKIPNACVQGPPGLPGRNGINGHNGLPGPYGRAGAKGEKGMVGSPGPRGVKGNAGQTGTDTEHRNWKQCAWRNTDGRDTGLIKDCVFDKKKDGTSLRVVYQGNIYLGHCDNCCKR